MRCNYIANALNIHNFPLKHNPPEVNVIALREEDDEASLRDILYNGISRVQERILELHKQR